MIPSATKKVNKELSWDSQRVQSKIKRSSGLFKHGLFEHGLNKNFALRCYPLFSLLRASKAKEAHARVLQLFVAASFGRSFPPNPATTTPSPHSLLHGINFADAVHTGESADVCGSGENRSRGLIGRSRFNSIAVKAARAALSNWTRLRN